MLFMHNFKHRKCHPLLDPTVDPSIKYVWPQISTPSEVTIKENILIITLVPKWLTERQKRDDSQSCRGTDDAMCLDLNHIQSSVASHLQTLQMRLWFVHVSKQEIFTLNDQWLVGRANTGFWFMTANYCTIPECTFTLEQIWGKFILVWWVIISALVRQTQRWCVVLDKGVNLNIWCNIQP